MTGEILPMVERTFTAEGEIWRALSVDLDSVALAIGTHGKGTEQRLKHIKERRIHERQLMLTNKCAQ